MPDPLPRVTIPPTQTNARVNITKRCKRMATALIKIFNHKLSSYQQSHTTTEKRMPPAMQTSKGKTKLVDHNTT